jgi:hypothetical protein
MADRSNLNRLPAAKFILLAEAAGGDISFEGMGDSAREFVTSATNCFSPVWII